jgi:hypothetical protein
LGKRTFKVYEALLTHYSSYFRTSLNGRWREARLKTIDLSEDKPEVFQAFFNWLMIGKLYARLTPEGNIPYNSRLICQIYVFGDARGIPELCNAAVDLLFQKNCQSWQIPTPVLQYIYANTPDNCTLRKLLVDDASETYCWTDIHADRDQFPKDFLIDVLRNLRIKELYPGGNQLGRGKWIHTKKLEICSKYHDHSAPVTAPTTS